LKTWKNNFGLSAAGDANLNGLTEGDDFLIWQQQYTGLKGIATIPEPGCIAIFLSGLFDDNYSFRPKEIIVYTVVVPLVFDFNRAITFFM